MKAYDSNYSVQDGADRSGGSASLSRSVNDSAMGTSGANWSSKSNELTADHLDIGGNGSLYHDSTLPSELQTPMFAQSTQERTSAGDASTGGEGNSGEQRTGNSGERGEREGSQRGERHDHGGCHGHGSEQGHERNESRGGSESRHHRGGASGNDTQNSGTAHGGAENSSSGSDGTNNGRNGDNGSANSGSDAPANSGNSSGSDNSANSGGSDGSTQSPNSGGGSDSSSHPGSDTSTPPVSGGSDASTPPVPGGSDTPSTPTDTPPAPGWPLPVGTAGMTVSPDGFKTADGQSWNMRGLNASVQEALDGFPNALTDYPNMTAIRLNVDPGKDNMQDIDKVISEYTAKGVAVIAEDHSGNQGNTQWYGEMAAKYKDNGLVMLETSNEPNGDAASVAQNQIAEINAIRSAGFTNPIGVQPVGGYDESNLQTVANATGDSSLFATPHIYYSGDDPNEAARYVSNQIDGARQAGMFTSIDEFGPAMDGYTRDPLGYTVTDAVIQANKNQGIGAVYWSMGNDYHPDGADSAFATPDGSQLTPDGQELQQIWLG